ncbi:MAG: outer membrane protein transport protein [Candidatus Omnitrophota bacterium]|nr:outer membrane protein transport protein [Candidatus Omnitrophota bacterium]
MFKRAAIVAFLSFILTVLSCSAVFANGFKNDALLDTEATGMATLFVAQADSPAAVQFNPAGLTQLKGNHARVGYTSAIPRNFRTDTSGNDQSSSQIDNFFIPSIYLVNNLKSENWKFGLGVTSPYGLGTDWADDSFARFQTTESSLQVLQINPTIAYKYNNTISLGFGIDYIMSETSSHKRIADTTGLGDFHAKGNDDGWGYNLGLLVKPSEKYSIGVAYRSRVKLTYKGTISMTNLSSGIYGSGGLGYFPNDTYVTGMESRLTLPQTLALGYAFKPDQKLTIETDAIWTDWSSVQEDFAKYTEEGDANRLAVLNDGNPLAKDWNATMSYGIAAKYQATDKLVLRCGYLYAETPVPAANFEPSMVDMDMHCVSVGAGYALKKDLTVDAAYFGGFYKDRYITNDIALSSGSDLDGMYESYVNVFSVSFTYKY